MSSEGSVTRWIAKLKAGEESSAERIWARYFDGLVRLARKRLNGVARRVADEEDVALSALKSVCLGARRGRFPELHNRDNLWRLLVVITARKAYDRRVHEGRAKRGGSKLRDSGSPPAFEQIISREPTPEFVVAMSDECRRLMDTLTPELRGICLWKLEGFTNQEIASKLGTVTRTVERKLRLIRTLWQKEGIG